LVLALVTSAFNKPIDAASDDSEYNDWGPAPGTGDA
jgi:hypothetical protein